MKIIDDKKARKGRTFRIVATKPWVEGDGTYMPSRIVLIHWLNGSFDEWSTHFQCQKANGGTCLFSGHYADDYELIKKKFARMEV
jgi:hypothetical protein